MVMKKAAVKDALRTIGRTKYRYISIFCIVALGVGFFAGVKASSPDMIYSTDMYSDRQELMDFRVLSTWGFDDEDIRMLSELDNAAIKPSYFYDCMTEGNSFEAETRFEAYDKNDGINKLELKNGRFPVSDDECLVDSASTLAPGTVLTITTEGADGYLKNTQFKVVGSAYSAMYISDYERGTTTVGSGALDRIVYISPSNFLYDYYTEVYIVYEDMKDAVVYTDEYNEMRKSKTEVIEALSLTACETRYDKTVKEANEKIADAEKEIEENKNKLADAEAELKEAEEKLADGKKQLDEAEALLSEKKAEADDAEKKINDGEEEIKRKTEEAANASAELIEARRLYEQGYAEYTEASRKAEKELAEARAKIEEGEAELANAKTELDSAWETYNSVKSAYDKAYGYYADLKKRYDAMSGNSLLKELLKEELDRAYEYFMSAEEYLNGSKAELDEKQAEFDKYEAELAQGRRKLEKSEKDANKRLTEAKKELDDAKAEIERNEDLLVEGTKKLEEARAELEEGKIKLAEGRAELESAEAELESKKADFAEAEKKYEEGRAEYEDGKKKLADGEKELEAGRKELASLEEPEWYVFTRDDNAGYAEYGENAERIKNIAKVFPAFFILVAALVCMTGMTRMVEEERTQIGTMKALGYTTAQILRKYTFYCLSATFLGCVVGLATGYKVFPFVIMKAYSILYRVRVRYMPFIFKDAVIITSFSLALSFITVALCCFKTMRPVPAKLMRAAAPAAGKRVLLERVGFIWNRLSFFGKVTVRNIFRYKKRMIMTLIGIMGCTALVLCGFALRDSISDILEKHFDSVINYKAFAMTSDMNEENRAEIEKIIKEYDPQAFDMLAMQKTETVSNGDTKNSAYVYVVESGELAEKMINFKNRTTGETYKLEKGSVLVTEKLASMLGVGVGDTVGISPDGLSESSVRVAGIVENYIYHFVYMLPETYENIAGEFDFNMIVFGYTADPETETAMMTEINASEAIVAVQTKTQLRATFARMMQALDAVVMVLIISAMLLAVVVLYNLASINIAERKREIATLEVLGFNDIEVSQYIFRESIVLTLAGTVAGLGLGRLLAGYVIKTAEIDLVMFGREIHPLSYVFAAVLTVLFSLAVDLYMNRPIRKISMVESLKSID